MKVLTTNFVKCPVRTCEQTGFPLKYKDCTLQQSEQSEFDPVFLTSLLDRMDWGGLVSVMNDLGNTSFPPTRPELLETELLNDLFGLLINTEIIDGVMMCPNCSHVMHIKNGVANFLLPPHLS